MIEQDKRKQEFSNKRKELEKLIKKADMLNISNIDIANECNVTQEYVSLVKNLKRLEKPSKHTIKKLQDFIDGYEAVISKLLTKVEEL